MADLNRFLRRFRRLVSPPGRPGPAAVPADRSAALADELDAVFRAIDGIQEEAERIRGQGEGTAKKRREAAGEEAERIVSEARERAEQERADEASRRRTEIEEEAREALDQAREEAEEVRRRAEAKLEPMVGRMVDDLLAADTEDGG